MSNEWNTKVVDFFEQAAEKIEILSDKRVNKSRVDFMKCVTAGMILGRSVQFCEIADKMNDAVEVRSNERRIQHFIAEYDLDMEWVMLLLLLMLPKHGKVNICLDRTTWAFGSQTHNILVVSIYTHGIGIPVWFECLDNEGGASEADDRMYLLLNCIKFFGKARIKCVIGDCEFIGKKWIDFLVQEKIHFYLDLPCSKKFIYRGKEQQIRTWVHGIKKKSLDGVEIYGHVLNICIQKQKPSKSYRKHKAILAILTDNKSAQAGGNYRNRWSIEVLFENLKLRGFDLECTHLKDPPRLRKLFALCAIAFTICFLTGLALNKKKPIAVKNHGYKSNSFFRHGLDFIRKALRNTGEGNLKTKIKEGVDYIFDFIGKIIHDNFLVLQKIVV